MNLTVSPAELTTAGETISGLYQKYTNQITEMYALIDKVNQSWNDPATQNYVEQINSYRSDFALLGTAIEQVGKFLVGSGEIYQKTSEKIGTAASNL